MYVRTLRKNTQTRRFTITEATQWGWEVREEEDDRLLAREVLSDWHRVERARLALDARAAHLKDAGWTEA